MNIEVRFPDSKEYRATKIEGDLTVKDLADKCQSEMPYKILLAKINNRYVSLTEKVKAGDSVELLDMRNQAANMAYQSSLSLIYLKSVRDVLGKVKVFIANSLSKGIFTVIKTKEVVTQQQIEEIYLKMKKIVEEDLPIKLESVSRDEAYKRVEQLGLKDKKELLDKAKELKVVKLCTLENYSNFFYGLMVPSTGYIDKFELRKYRNGVLMRFPHNSNPDIMPEFVEEPMLYQAFREATLWGRLLEIENVTDLNEEIENNKIKTAILLSEALHEQRVIEIAKDIIDQEKRIILIAGPSSSGKTTFAKRLCIQLQANGIKPLYLGTDDYFVERDETPLDEKGERNYEDIEAIDLELFNKNMNDLLEGKTVDLPSFDFIDGKKKFGNRITKIGKEQTIVIEGIHGLNKILTQGIDEKEKYKVYISPLTQLNIDDHNRIPTTDARMLRRLVRDYNYRGHCAESTIADWPKVRAGENKNIFPYNDEADVLFNSALVYELSVLKKYAEPILEQVSPTAPEYGEAVRMLRLLSFFRTIKDDAAIGNNSIIREFIGGSIFVD